MNWQGFLDQLQDWLSSRQLLGSETSWVIGVSGGPDSALLLHAMKALSDREGLGWKLQVAHLHHGLRGDEADADAQYASQLADQLGLPFRLERIDIRAEVERSGGSTEEVARRCRYEFLERVALQVGSELVAVGHHADDNAETIIHRICRGTGLRGLSGIRDVRPIRPESRIRLVRPLLNQRRATIEELCAARGLKLRIDSTNRSPQFTRGRIRQTIMPLLAEQLNPGVVEALLRLSEQARLMSVYLEDAAGRTFESLLISQGPRHVVLNNRALLGKQRIIQAEVVRRAVSLVSRGEQDLGFAHLEAVLRLAEDAASGKQVHLPGRVVVRKQYDRLEFRPLDEEEEAPELGIVFVACPGRTSLPALRYILTAEICDVDGSKLEALRHNTNPYEEWLDYGRVRPPLLVRGRREGDRFHPLGAPGAKTVSEFLSEQKIEPHLRARTGILCDQQGPLWVMPLRIDERAKLRSGTRRALRLTLTPYLTQPASPV